MKNFWVIKPLVFIVAFVSIVGLACGSSSSESPVVKTPVNTMVSSITESTSTPEPIIPTPTEEKVLGLSRSNPAPVGSEIIADDMSLVILEVVRPADSIVAKGNMFNSTPEPGKEYLFVKLKITCMKSSDGKCSIYSSNYKIVTSTGNVVDPEWFIAGVSGLLETSDFFGGASTEGYVAFIIDKTEISPVLMYEPFFSDPVYLLVQ